MADDRKPLGRKLYGSIPHLPGSRLGPGDHHCQAGQAALSGERTPGSGALSRPERLRGAHSGGRRGHGGALAVDAEADAEIGRAYACMGRCSTGCSTTIWCSRASDMMAGGPRCCGGLAVAVQVIDQSPRAVYRLPRLLPARGLVTLAGESRRDRPRPVNLAFDDANRPHQCGMAFFKIGGCHAEHGLSSTASRALYSRRDSAAVMLVTALSITRTKQPSLSRTKRHSVRDKPSDLAMGTGHPPVAALARRLLTVCRHRSPCRVLRPT